MIAIQDRKRRWQKGRTGTSPLAACNRAMLSALGKCTPAIAILQGAKCYITEFRTDRVCLLMLSGRRTRVREARISVPEIRQRLLFPAEPGAWLVDVKHLQDTLADCFASLSETS